jgi:hypothetical protein
MKNFLLVVTLVTGFGCFLITNDAFAQTSSCSELTFPCPDENSFGTETYCVNAGGTPGTSCECGTFRESCSDDPIM